MASRTFLSLVTSLLVCAGGIMIALPAQAETPLLRATIQKVKNRVVLNPKRQAGRQAQIKDEMTPGDALQTFQKAMAELRFNDSSVARIGERAIFNFEPNTRNMDLKSGTVLLLIQPGQGKTRVRTPNAAAGIRGSALFIRYIEDSGVTMVGALTNSDIEISNADGTQTVVLKAGQMGYVHQGRIGVFNFDQKLFQETSPFFKDIDWNEAPGAVREEIEAALQQQSAIAGNYQDTPDWTKLADNRSTPPTAVEVATAANPLRPPIEKDLLPTGNSGQPVVPPSNSGNSTGSGVITAPLPGEPAIVSPQPPMPTLPSPPTAVTPAPLPDRPVPQPVPPTIVTPPSAVPTPTPPSPTAPPISNIPTPVNPPTRPVPAPPSGTIPAIPTPNGPGTTIPAQPSNQPPVAPPPAPPVVVVPPAPAPVAPPAPPVVAAPPAPAPVPVPVPVPAPPIVAAPPAPAPAPVANVPAPTPVVSTPVPAPTPVASPSDLSPVSLPSTTPTPPPPAPTTPQVITPSTGAPTP